MNTDKKNKIVAAFQSLGISTGATDVYLLLLLTNEHNLSKIAKALHISRPHLYKLLGELEIQELIHFEKRVGSDTRLQISPPTLILQKVRESKQKISSIENSFIEALPQLMSDFDQGNSASKIKIVTGTNDFLKLLMGIAEEERHSLIYFGSIEHFIDCISWSNQEKWMRARVAAGMKINALVLESAEAYLLKRRDKAQLRETRILNIPETFVTSYHVFSNKTVFWQPKAKMAIMIEDQHIAQMMRATFYSLWEKTKAYS